MITSARTTLARILVLVAALAAPGVAGATTSKPDQQTFLQTHRLDLLEADCSGSFRQTSETFVPEMVTIAENSAQLQRALWAGCFDGAPLRDLIWNPTIDFGALPSTISNNPSLASRFNQARALGLEPKLTHMIKTTPTRVPGSGQLEALELAAQTSSVGRVFMFTDAEINEVGGINLITATPRQIEQTIERWTPRLSGLRGVQLMFIGVGRDVHVTASVRNAEVLFEGLAKAVGASFSWDQNLPLGFQG
jgi:hypothetical protein